MYMLVCNFVSIASALFYVYACMLGCMYVCELGGSFARGSSSLAIYILVKVKKTHIAHKNGKNIFENVHVIMRVCVCI